MHATRAISGRSVPISTCIAAGAGAVIRLFGPESIGGAGDIGAKSHAEVASTGLSSVRLVLRCISRVMLLDGLLVSDLVSKDITPYRRETYLDSWPSCNASV
jgi:hypothetical protein